MPHIIKLVIQDEDIVAYEDSKGRGYTSMIDNPSFNPSKPEDPIDNPKQTPNISLREYCDEQVSIVVDADIKKSKIRMARQAAEMTERSNFKSNYVTIDKT